MPKLLTPRRRRGVEYLDSPDVDPTIVTRSLADVARANALFGGTSCAIEEVKQALDGVGSVATLLDVGTGLGDIPRRAREIAHQQGVQLTTIGLDAAAALAKASKSSVSFPVCGDALRLRVGLAFGGHAAEVPGDRQRPLVVDRHAELDVVAGE